MISDILVAVGWHMTLGATPGGEFAESGRRSRVEFESMLPPQDECACCRSTAYRYLFEKRGRHFWRCTRCGMEKQHPLPSIEELKAYYERSYRDGMYKVFAEAEEIKRLTALGRYKAVKRYARSGKWLDVGCFNGVFVEVAQGKGQDAEGIDLSVEAVEQGRARGLPLRCSTVEDFEAPVPFDTITCFDIIEHVLDPLAFLQSVRRLLAPDGTVCLTFPDQGGLVRRLMGSRWYFYIPEEHLHYFNARNIGGLLERAGLEKLVHKQAFKTLTYAYSLTQFQEYNPLIYRVLNAAGKLLPKRALSYPVNLPIGEMLVVARPITLN